MKILSGNIKIDFLPDFSCTYGGICAYMDAMPLILVGQGD